MLMILLDACPTVQNHPKKENAADPNQANM